MCYYFKRSIEIKHIDIARHRYCLQIRGYKGFIAQQPQIGGHRDFNQYDTNKYNKNYKQNKTEYIFCVRVGVRNNILQI